MSTEPSLQTLAGMRVSHIWFSDHSILYLELGVLSPGRVCKNGAVGNPKGEVSVFFGYDWIARNAESEVARRDVHQNKNRLDALVATVLGASIQAACLSKQGLEIEISLSTGVTLCSVSTDLESPDWDVGFDRNRRGWLHVKEGRLQFEMGD